MYEEDASGLHVDLFLPSTSADLLSVSKKLVTMGLAARARGGKKDAPRIPSPAIPALGEEVQVVVSTAYSPHDFYVQMVSVEMLSLSVAEEGGCSVLSVLNLTLGLV